DGLEVRGQATGQPHQLDVALGLPLKPTARLKPIEVAVEVDLQHRRRVIGGPTGRRGLDAIKAKRRKIKLIDEDFDHPNRVVLGHVIVERLRQQQRLPSVFALDKTPHDQPSKNEPILSEVGVFTQAGPFCDLPKVRYAALTLGYGARRAWTAQ